MKPIFAVQQPSFLGIDSDINLSTELIEKYAGEKELQTDKFTTIYLHRKMEDRAGFDIVAWLKGTVKNTPSQECLVILPDGTETEGILCLKDNPSYNRYYGLICIPEEQEETLKDLENHIK